MSSCRLRVWRGPPTDTSGATGSVSHRWVSGDTGTLHRPCRRRAQRAHVCSATTATQRYAVLRPRCERDGRGAGSERRTDRGPGQPPRLGRPRRRPRVAAAIRAAPRQLAQGALSRGSPCSDLDLERATGRGSGGCPEARDELLRGPARDAARYGRRPDAGRRDRLPRAPRLDPGRAARELVKTAKAARGRTILPVGLSLGGIALVDLVASWPEAPVEACVTVGSQAPLLYTFDAIPSLPYDEADPPRLPVPWLNVYDSRDFLSFVAEPLFRRTDGLATVVDLRVHSGRDFPRSHSAYWECRRSGTGSRRPSPGAGPIG